MAQTLTQHMFDKEYTVIGLAEASGVSADTIYRCRKGHMPLIATARLLADTLGIVMAELRSLIEAERTVADDAR